MTEQLFTNYSVHPTDPCLFGSSVRLSLTSVTTSALTRLVTKLLSQDGLVLTVRPVDTSAFEKPRDVDLFVTTALSNQKHAMAAVSALVNHFKHVWPASGTHPTVRLCVMPGKQNSVCDAIVTGVKDPVAFRLLYEQLRLYGFMWEAAERQDGFMTVTGTISVPEGQIIEQSDVEVITIAIEEAGLKLAAD